MFSTSVCLENGKDDSSSEAYLQGSKTSRGSYLDPAISIFVKIFEFYLVTQSLYHREMNVLEPVEHGIFMKVMGVVS
jgi:hypothetical protein